MDRQNLALVTLDSDFTDGVGNVYPKSGFVKAAHFKTNKDIMSGLFGILWGRTNSEQYLKHGSGTVWLVVKINRDENLIVLDEDENVVKFETGLVVCCGTKLEASSYIAEEVQRSGDFSVTEIAGYVDEADVPNRSAFAQGHSGEAVSNVASLHAIGMACQTKALASQMESYAVAFGAKGEATVLEDMSVAVAAGPESVAKSVGDGSSSVALTPFSRALSMGPDGVAVCIEPGGTASAGPNGALVMAYKDFAEKTRYAVGYVGDEVLSNRMYECDSSGDFILIS
jgi:hypothetical protein